MSDAPDAVPISMRERLVLALLILEAETGPLQSCYNSLYAS